MDPTGTALYKDVHTISTRWVGKMHFICRVNDHDLHIDKLAIHGGNDTGPRPKQLILSAVSGCTGMEIISILEKMRVKIEKLEIDVSGELTTDLPKMYKSVHIIFSLICKETDREKVTKAIRLAVDKYCGVLAMVRRFAQVTTDIKFV